MGTPVIQPCSTRSSILFICLSVLFATVPFSIRGQIVINTSGDSNVVTFKVKENSPAGSPIGNIREGIRPPPHESVIFQLNDNPYFSLAENGELSVSGSLDRDKDTSLCIESGFPALCVWSSIIFSPSRLLSLKVIVEDLNDNAPMWSKPPIISIPENVPVNSTAEFPLATDSDSGQNGIVRYAIQSPTQLFVMENLNSLPNGNQKARIIVKGKLDRETSAWHNLTITAVDGTAPLHTGTTTLAIQVTDENDNAPVFDKPSYVATIKENMAVGSALSLIPRATDLDDGIFRRIRYKFSLSTPDEVLQDFEIDPDTGQIKIKRELDYSRKNEYKFQIVAQDGGSPSKTAEATVSIKLEDTNNNAPVIQITETKRIVIQENLPAGAVVTTFTVKDKDTGINGEFVCKLTSEENFKLNYIGQFHMSVYKLETQRSFDREDQSMVRATVRCLDKGSPQQSSTEVIKVEIGDDNDNGPKFLPTTYDIQTTEGNEPGAKIGRVSATDADQPDHENSRLVFNIQWPSGEGENPFSVNEKGEIIASRMLDRESRPQGYEFMINVHDSGTPQRSASAPVKIALMDINDCTPQFDQPEYSFAIEEDPGKNFTTPRSLGQIRATDCDSGPNSLVRYRLDNQQNYPFEISSTGHLQTRGVLDRESTNHYLLHVVAEDQADPVTQRLSSTAKIFISIRDINDNTPIFEFPNATYNKVRVSYKEERNFVITQVRARDLDVGVSGQVRYLIAKGNLYRVFHLRESTGELVVGEEIKEVHVGTYYLTISAVDNGIPIRSSSCELQITVDKSTPLGNARRVGGQGSVYGLETNKLIIICIVVATGIISLVLITAISIMARRTPGCASCSDHDDRDMSPNKDPTRMALYPVPGNTMLLSHPGAESGLMEEGGTLVRRLPLNSTTYQMGPHLSDYPAQTTQLLTTNMETFRGPSTMKPPPSTQTTDDPRSHDTLDSDADSGRGASLSGTNNIRLAQYHLFHPHQCQSGSTPPLPPPHANNSASAAYAPAAASTGFNMQSQMDYRPELWGTLQRGKGGLPHHMGGVRASGMPGGPDHLHFLKASGPLPPPPSTTATSTSIDAKYASLPRGSSSSLVSNSNAKSNSPQLTQNQPTTVV